ncbi:hypothetical protein AB0M02_16920 [Actinoplanes sp. NPDC051861]|uniref:hypothetical protein n=1 Tax=Actinoplanes sp. NPDC051861 TaxID=3155170 RepID=UPI0034422BC4
MMENAFDVAYRVVEVLFGPDSGVPWWAWVAPLVMIFAKLLGPVVAPEAAGAGGGTGSRSGSGSGKKGKKGKAKKK